MRSLAPVQDSPSVKTVRNMSSISAGFPIYRALQTYTASVTSVLPALMSAIRVSPPQDGPAHDGKVIGRDSVTYKYNQVCLMTSLYLNIS